MISSNLFSFVRDLVGFFYRGTPCFAVLSIWIRSSLPGPPMVCTENCYQKVKESPKFIGLWRRVLKIFVCLNVFEKNKVCFGSARTDFCKGWF